MYGAVVTWTLLSANCRNNEKSKIWKKRFESKSQKFVACLSCACHVTEEELFVLCGIFHEDDNSFSMRTLKNNKEESALVFFHIRRTRKKRKDNNEQEEG